MVVTVRLLEMESVASEDGETPEGEFADLSALGITVLVESIAGNVLVVGLVDSGLKLENSGSNNGCAELEADVAPSVAVVILFPLLDRDTGPKEYEKECNEIHYTHAMYCVITVLVYHLV